MNKQIYNTQEFLPIGARPRGGGLGGPDPGSPRGGGIPAAGGGRGAPVPGGGRGGIPGAKQNNKVHLNIN